MSEIVVKSNENSPQNEGGAVVCVKGNNVCVYNGTETSGVSEVNNNWGDRLDFESDYDIKDFSVSVLNSSELVQPSSLYGTYLIPYFLDGYELFKVNAAVEDEPNGDDINITLVDITDGENEIEITSSPIIIPDGEKTSFDSTRATIIPDKSIMSQEQIYAAKTSDGDWADANGLCLYFSCRKHK